MLQSVIKNSFSQRQKQSVINTIAIHLTNASCAYYSVGVLHRCAEVGGSDPQLSKVQSAISLSSHFGSEVSLESMDSDQGPTRKVTHHSPYLGCKRHIFDAPFTLHQHGTFVIHILLYTSCTRHICDSHFTLRRLRTAHL